MLEPILLLVLAAFVVVCLYRDKSKKTDNLLFTILILSTLNEVVSKLLRYYGHPIGLMVTAYVILTSVLWLLILKQVSRQKKIIVYAIFAFLVFSVYNFIFLDGLSRFNGYTFIIGAFLYLFLFIYDNFQEMKKENFDYFFSNRYLLISAPVLFFIGFSFIFGFRSKVLDDIHIFPNLKLYDFISYVVNTVYYLMIIYYIYKSKKQKKCIVKSL